NRYSAAKSPATTLARLGPFRAAGGPRHERATTDLPPLCQALRRVRPARCETCNRNRNYWLGPALKMVYNGVNPCRQVCRREEWILMLPTTLAAWTQIKPCETATRAGLRFGDKGTHTSRTIMLAELTELLATVPDSSTRKDYAKAIIDENALGKNTASTRRLTNQRLGELYGLDPKIPLCRVLRRLWAIDEAGRPL